jgi:uncharacterized iron-regulated membrane protein
MSPASIRFWSTIHRWTSLLCTVFLLMICLTGLPLIFREEIGDWLNTDPPYAVLPPNTPMAALDDMVAEAVHRYPDQIVTSIFIDDDEPKVLVSMASSWQAFMDQPGKRHWLKFDARTARLLRESDPPGTSSVGFVTLMLRLHTDLFVGLPGSLFLGATGCLFVVALISGVMLYAPFMRRLSFGTIRFGRSRQMQWLDLHNLLSVVALVWMLTAGVTGVMNELSLPLFALWQNTDVKAMLHRWQGDTPPVAAEFASPDTVVHAAQAALPSMHVISVVYPGSRFGSPFHYVVWTKGDTPLTSRLFSPVLVDARTGALTAVVQMPWYLRALEVSRPLHFGDYGGTPLKLIWASLDIATIMVLLSGVYLWMKPRRTLTERRNAGDGSQTTDSTPHRTPTETPAM